MLRPANQLVIRQSQRIAARAASTAAKPKRLGDELAALMSKNEPIAAAQYFIDHFDPAARGGMNELRNQYNGLFNELRQATRKQSEPPSVSVKDLFYKFLQADLAVGWMCSTVIMDDVLQGHAEKALEAWVRFMETITDTDAVSAPVNSEAAWSALVAYIVNCQHEGVPIDSAVAQRLVPLKMRPTVSDVMKLPNIRQLPKEQLDVVLDGIKQLRLDKLDFNSPEFLKTVRPDAMKDLEAKLAEAKQKSEESGVPFSELTYAQFMTCFAEGTRIQTAFDLWNELQEHMAPTVISFNALLKAGSLSRQDNVLLVEKIWEQMLQAGVAPDSESYSILMELYFRRNLPMKALQMYNDIQQGKIAGCTVTLKMFSLVLNGLLRMKEVALAEQVLKEGQDQGYSMSVIAYNAFLRTYLRERDFDKVKMLMQDMRENKIDPDVSTYTTMIDAIYKMYNQSSGGSRDQADKTVEGLLDEMSSNRLRANAVTLTSVIDGLIKTSRDIRAARKVFETMIKKRMDPNARTFATMVNGEVLLGDMDRAVKLLNKMPEHNQTKTTPVYNQLIKGFAARGQLDDAYNMFMDLVKDKRTDPNKYSYYFILQACQKSNDMDRAKRVLDVMANHSYDFDWGTQLPKIIKSLEQRGVELPSGLMQKNGAR